MRLCRFFNLFAGMMLLSAMALHASSLPQEPEHDNKEYLLDHVTNDYNREWREIWDGGDNRLSFRFGSNNVREWFIEERLKFSSHLLKRLRLRFYHSRLLNYTSRKNRINTIEFEGRLWSNYYASIIAVPTEMKDDNSLGFMFQRRTAVNRYAIVYFELPRFLNNFTEHHKGTYDPILSVYSRQPVRFGLEFRDNITRHVMARLSGYMSNNFAFAAEDQMTRKRTPQGGGRVKTISGWIEYIDDTTKAVASQNAFGVEGGYTFIDKFRPLPLLTSTYDMGFPIGKDDTRLPLKSLGLTLPYIEFGIDPFKPIEEDSVLSWRETRKFASPYIWLSLNRSVKLRADLRIEKWALEWKNTDLVRSDISDHYIVPSLRVRVGIGARKASVVEGGYLAEYRKRRERRKIGTSGVITENSHRYDHRISIAYEYRFRPDAAIRIIESIDLDRRDWGQFSIHDHGFFQLIVGF